MLKKTFIPIMKITLAIFIIALSSISIASEDNPVSKKEEPEKEHFFTESGKYLMAQFARKTDNPELSYKMFLSVFSKNHNESFLLQDSYRQSLVANNFQNTLDIAKLYISRGKISVFSALILATDNINKKNYKAAEALMTPLINNKNKNILSDVNVFVVPLTYAWIKAQQGMTEEALEIIDDTHKMFPENLKLFTAFNKGIMYDLASQKKEAKSEFDKISGETKLSYNITKIIGNFYERNNDTETALKIYNDYNYNNLFKTNYFNQRIKDINNNKPSKDKIIKNHKSAISELFKEAAKIIYNEKIKEESLMYLSLAFQLNPEDTEIRFLKASFLENTRKYEDAIKIYEKIKEDSNEYLFAQLLIAENLYNLGEEKKSIEFIDNVYKKNPDNHSLMLSLAELMQLNKRYEESVEIYTKIINDLSLSDTDNKNYWFLFLSRGISHERLHNLDEAEKDLNKALKLNPNNPKILNYLGYTWIENNKNLNQALNMVILAGKISPKDPQIIDSIGWGLYKLKLYDKALLFLEKASEITPYDATINYHLGNLYYKKNRLTEAVYQFKRSLEYPSDDIDKKEIEDILKELVIKK